MVVRLYPVAKARSFCVTFAAARRVLSRCASQARVSCADCGSATSPPRYHQNPTSVPRYLACGPVQETVKMPGNPSTWLPEDPGVREAAYYRIADDLRRKIMTGVLVPG